MEADDREPVGVILLSMGGPDKIADVKQFLFNIFSDRTIIRLPGGRLFQKPFARFISSRRSKHVEENYRKIGGGSPLLKWTQIQADILQDHLAKTIPGSRCFVGMRYFQPTIEKAILQARRENIKHLVLLPMYPHYSMTTTGSSFSVAREIMAGLPELRATFIEDIHDRGFYISLLRDYISSHIGPDDTLLFSAHSIPRRFVDEGDPYVDQVRKTAHMAADGREHFVAFQSRTGPVKWVGPDTIDETKRLLSERSGNLFLVPISFVCDHIETLYEIDMDLKQILGDEMASRLKRMPMFNDDCRLGKGLAELVLNEVCENARL